MRTLITITVGLILAGCGGSDTASSGTSGSGGTTAGTGGTTSSVASGTATLSGTGAFDAGSVFFQWQATPDGGASRASAQLVFADVHATCAQLKAGLNQSFSTLRELGIQPRLDDGGAVVAGHYGYDDHSGQSANGMNLGWFGLTIGEADFPSGYDSLSADLTTVQDDLISGSFVINWSAPDGGAMPAPLQGTFTAPLCGPLP